MSPRPGMPEPVELRHLGEFSGLAAVAARQRGLFPPATPGPELRAAAREALGVLDVTADDVRVERTWTDGDLHGEELSWTLGYGPRTHAYLLRPRDADGPLPGVVALHCHAGMKWPGKEKIADGPDPATPEVRRVRDELYGGRAYANALARRGFVVLAHDVLAWGSRRVPLTVMPDPVSALADPAGPAPASAADRYDIAAAQHEHVLAKYCTLLGTSFAGVVAGEDLAAAAYLRSRPDVADIGCVGLSGGGLRAALLGAFDPAMRAVAIIAMASSYRDMLDRHVATHTWMLYPPGLTRLCDYPDLVASRAPAPLLVQYATEDALFPLSGMRRAHATITEHYRATPSSYEGTFHEVPHSFTRNMQEEAFTWLTRHLPRPPSASH